MDADPPPPDDDDELARLLDLRGEGTEHRCQHAANDAAAIAAFYAVLEANELPEEACVHLTVEWMQLGHRPVPWDDSQPDGGES